MTPTAERIEARVRERLRPRHFELGDESAQHAGHAGAAAGGGHYRLLIVSSEFEGRTLLERHRMVYEALSDLMGREIHALSMRTLAPGEWPG